MTSPLAAGHTPAALAMFDAYGMGEAIPSTATPRDPDAPTIGRRIARTSLLLGPRLMPWQRYVADVAGELDANGMPRYSTVIVSIPRQGGKTTLVLAVGADRALTRPRSRVYYTAQTRYDAVDNWRGMATDLDERFKGTPLDGLIAAKIGTGNERLVFPNRSTFQPFAPTMTSLHGKTSPLVMLDECFAFDITTGEDLDAAVVPTHATIPESQDWYISTAGDARSMWWHTKLDEAVARATDPDSRTAVFIWSADPDLADADPYADRTLAFHPALGHTQTPRSLRAMAEKMSLGNWRRSVLNLRTQSAEAVIDLDAWDTLATATEPPADPTRVPMALDVTPDRSSSSLVAAWPTTTGTAIGLVATGPGMSWLIERALAAHHDGHPLIADDTGPNRTAVAQLRAAGATVHTTTPREYSTACQRFLDNVAAACLTHDGEPIYREQLAAAVIKPMGGAVGFNPYKSAGPIDALRALTLASWAVQDVANRPTIQIF